MPITSATMDSGVVTLTIQCPSCKLEQKMNVLASRYDRWNRGELIQNVFPYMSADQRELLITGICKVCWDLTFRGGLV